MAFSPESAFETLIDSQVSTTSAQRTLPGARHVLSLQRAHREGSYSGDPEHELFHNVSCSISCRTVFERRFSTAVSHEANHKTRNESRFNLYEPCREKFSPLPHFAQDCSG